MIPSDGHFQRLDDAAVHTPTRRLASKCRVWTNMSTALVGSLYCAKLSTHSVCHLLAWVI